MTAFMNSCEGLVAQPSLRNREEMRTGGPHHVSKIIPLCLVTLALKANRDSDQHLTEAKAGKEVVAL